MSDPLVEHLLGTQNRNVAEERIDQVGEPIDRLSQDFRVLPMFRTQKSLA
jgi:hypothetical protein